MHNEFRKSTLDYKRDVERLIACVLLPKSSYEANFTPANYPSGPLKTPLGVGTLRILGRDEAVFEAPEILIYRVSYQVHAFVKRVDGGLWEIDRGIRVLMRNERSSRLYDNTHAARLRFEKVALPAIVAALEDPDMLALREAAQASRLAWEISDDERDIARLDEMIAEIKMVRRSKTVTVANARAEIRSIGELLERDRTQPAA